MADNILEITSTSRVVLNEQPQRKTAMLVNYSDGPIWLGLGVPAVVGQGINVGINGGAYVIDRASGTFTTVYVAAIQDNPGPKALGVTETVWDVNDAPQFAQLSDVSFFDRQAGDAVIYNGGDGLMENGPILFGQSWEVDGSVATGLYKEPIEIPSDWKLLGVRMHSKSLSGAVEVDIHSADFGGTFASIVGGGTKPALDTANGPWFEDTTFADWDITSGLIASWLWLEVVSCTLDSFTLALSFQRTAQEIG